MAPFTVSTRGVVLGGKAGSGLHDSIDLGRDDAKGSLRVDASTNVKDTDLVFTTTDNTVRTLASGKDLPWLPDLLATADRKIWSNDDHRVCGGVGFDAGQQSALARAKYATTVKDVDLTAKAYYFQKPDNQVRLEGCAKFEAAGADHHVWAASNVSGGEGAEGANPTLVNLKLREGYLIEPFVLPIADRAVRWTASRDDKFLSLAYDLGNEAAFVEAGGEVADDLTLRAGYAVKDKVALVELAKRAEAGGNKAAPAVRAFVKANVDGGVKDPSGGVIVEKSFEW